MVNLPALFSLVKEIKKSIQHISNNEIRNMKTIIISATAIAAFLSTGNDSLTGKWQSQPSVNGNTTSMLFKPDNSFEGFVNRKPFVTGNYILTNDTFSFVDNGCDGKQGTYKLQFFSNKDSLRFKVIEDECTERKEGMLRLVVGRVK
jgi:hypothetical protein